MTKQSKSGAEKLEGDWYGQQATATSDPLKDNGVGKPIILRFFEFTANPEIFKRKPSKQELFNAHAQQIRLFLWRDGLDIVDVIEPKVILGTDTYKIAVTCQPKSGIALVDTPQTLQQLTKPHGRTTTE